MDRQTLRQIMFESKQMNKQYRSPNKKKDFLHSKNVETSSTLGSICLLGSLQMNQKNIIQEAPSIKKFQIVQLKKQRTKTPKKQLNKYDSVIRSQLKSRQIRSHRDSFKVDRLEHSQLGMFQKSFGIKFSEKPIYFLEGEIISLKRGDQFKRSQRNNKMEHGNSSLNIESLPEKFIPQQILNSRQYKRIYQQQRKKIIEQTNQSIKKTVNLNSEDHKQSQQIQRQRFRSTQITNEIFLNQSNARNNALSINRATSMTGVPKRNLLKKIFEEHKQYQDKIQKQKKQVLQIRKEVNKNYAKPFNPPENISAQSYIVYEITKKQSRYRKVFQANTQKRRFMNSHKILVQYNSRTPVEIASLTKIMTFILALEICQKYQKDSTQQTIKIGIFQQNITGTTANLVKGEIYTLQQLFYGLMLPSGNDASLAIAVWGGRILIENTQNLNIEIDSNLFKRKRQYYDRFLQQMNKKAEQFRMQKTHYANSHGLMNFQNKSCAFDLALLCQYGIQKPKFKEVVNTKQYECFVPSQKQDCSTIASPTLTNRSFVEKEQLEQMKDFDANQNYQEQNSSEQKANQASSIQNQIYNSPLKQNKLFTKRVYWQNTHLLVQDKPELYKGIKTGITNTAGPCLSSQIQYKGRQFIIVVLNCRTMKQRFRDTQNLRKWTFQKEQIIFSQ